MYGVYAKSAADEMHLIMSDLSPATSYKAGMIYTEEEVVNIANRWWRKTEGLAFVVKE